MKKLIVLVVIAVAVIALAFVLGKPSETKLKENARFHAAVIRLVGKSEVEADRALVQMGMIHRLRISTSDDWHSALDHVTPAPKNRPKGAAIRYTDDAKLTRKCVFLYLDKDHRVHGVHIATEYW